MARICRRRVGRGESGSALVEFSVVSLVFFMTLFGLIEFAQAVWHYNMVANLAQEGARWASVRGSGATGAVSPASAAEVQSYVQTRALGLSVAVATTSVDATTKACTATAVNPSSLSTGGRL